MFNHGVYCLNTFRMFTDEEPVAAQALLSTPDSDGRFTEVEETVQWTMRFPSGTLRRRLPAMELNWAASTVPWGWLQMTSYTY